MAATAEQIARVRRMTAEATEANGYTDEAIGDYIEDYPLVDENGESPRVPSTTTPGEMMENPDWTATYDLNAAAAAIWQEKAASNASDYDYTADGATLNRGQVHDQALKMARFYLARRSPKTITMIPDKARERTYETN
jgi:hypothetical protein